MSKFPGIVCAVVGPTSHRRRNHGGPPPVASRRYRIVTGCLSIRLNYSEILVIAAPRHNAKLIRSNVKPHPKDRPSSNPERFNSPCDPRNRMYPESTATPSFMNRLISPYMISSFANSINLTKISISKCVYFNEIF